MDRFLGCQDVELVGIEDQLAVGARGQRVPELADVVAATHVHVDDAGVAARAISDEPVAAGEIDRDGDAACDVGTVGIHEPLALVKRQRLVRVEDRPPLAEPDLRQARACAHEDREGSRADLDVERPLIAGLDLVEGPGTVGDDAGEDIEPAGRALGIGVGGEVTRQAQFFQQRHDVDAPGLQHRAAHEIEPVERQLLQALLHDVLRSRKEARADAVGRPAEPEVEARGLHLILRQIVAEHDLAIGDEAPYGMRRQDALPVRYVAQRRFRRHRFRFPPVAGGPRHSPLAEPALDAKAGMGQDIGHPVVI